MESDEKVQRGVIWFLVKQGKSGAEILHDLTTVYGTHAFGKTTVYKWVERFKAGWDTTEDEPRSGRPSTSTSTENIHRVQSLVDEDRRMTVEQIAEALGLSYGCVWNILHEDLGMSKLNARWVPKLLTDSQKKVRADVCKELLNQYNANPGQFLSQVVTGDESWFHYYEPESKRQSQQWIKRGEMPPVKAKTTQSAGKRMATVFWDSKGILLLEWLPEGETVNSSYYIKILTKLKEEIKSQRRGKWTRQVYLLHDNARPHTSQQTSAAIADLGFHLLPHPPYSPDLAPSDYHLFPNMKLPLRGKTYSNISSLASAVNQWRKVTPVSFYTEGIEKLPERWEKCVAIKGGYFEKMDTTDN